MITIATKKALRGALGERLLSTKEVKNIFGVKDNRTLKQYVEGLPIYSNGNRVMYWSGDIAERIKSMEVQP